MKIWTPCEMCEEFMCNIHEMHAADCECPVLDVWLGDGHSPYDDDVDDAARLWVAQNPLEDE